MNAVRRRKLFLYTFIVFFVGLAAGLILYALNQNVSLFYSPSQVAESEAPLAKLIRVGGMVEKGSVKREKNSLMVEFVITDFRHSVVIAYQGSLPDLFREGQGIVALGKLNEKKVFVAQQILAKHDENYMPPEVKSALEKGRR